MKLRDELKLAPKLTVMKPINAAAAAQQQQFTSLNDIGEKLDQLIKLLGNQNGGDGDSGSDPNLRSAGKDPNAAGTAAGAGAADAEGAHQMLSNQGFEHSVRQQMGGNNTIDMYQHPAGHTAMVQSKGGQVGPWGISYGRGLGSPNGSGASALQQHLNQSASFLKNEGMKKPVK